MGGRLKKGGKVKGGTLGIHTFSSERGQEAVLARGKGGLDVWVSPFGAVVVVIVSMAESV